MSNELPFLTLPSKAITNIKSKLKVIDILNEEMDILTRKIQETDTGHIHTTIRVLENRVQELREEIVDCLAVILKEKTV